MHLDLNLPYHIEVGTEWSLLCKWHFQMHFLVLKLLHLAPSLTTVFSYGGPFDNKLTFAQPWLNIYANVYSLVNLRPPTKHNCRYIWFVLKKMFQGFDILILRHTWLDRSPNYYNIEFLSLCYASDTKCNLWISVFSFTPLMYGSFLRKPSQLCTVCIHNSTIYLHHLWV